MTIRENGFRHESVDLTWTLLPPCPLPTPHNADTKVWTPLPPCPLPTPQDTRQCRHESVDPPLSLSLTDPTRHQTMPTRKRGPPSLPVPYRPHKTPDNADMKVWTPLPPCPLPTPQDTRQCRHESVDPPPSLSLTDPTRHQTMPTRKCGPPSLPVPYRPHKTPDNADMKVWTPLPPCPLPTPRDTRQCRHESSGKRHSKFCIHKKLSVRFLSVTRG